MKRQKQIQCFLGKKCLFKFEKMRFTQTSKSLSRSCCRESVTRWLDYFLIFDHLYQCKFAQQHKIFANLRSKVCQIVNKAYKRCQTTFKNQPKWQNFAKSGHTDPNPNLCVRVVASKLGSGFKEGRRARNPKRLENEFYFVCRSRLEACAIFVKEIALVGGVKLTLTRNLWQQLDKKNNNIVKFDGQEATVWVIHTTFRLDRAQASASNIFWVFILKLSSLKCVIYHFHQTTFKQKESCYFIHCL